MNGFFFLKVTTLLVLIDKFSAMARHTNQRVVRLRYRKPVFRYDSAMRGFFGEIPYPDILYVKQFGHIKLQKMINLLNLRYCASVAGNLF